MSSPQIRMRQVSGTADDVDPKEVQKRLLEEELKQHRALPDPTQEALRRTVQSSPNSPTRNARDLVTFVELSGCLLESLL